MKRLVLDAGPLIALVSIKDDYHQECKAGFSKPIMREVFRTEASVRRASRPSPPYRILARNNYEYIAILNHLLKIDDLVAHPTWQWWAMPTLLIISQIIWDYYIVVPNDS